MKRIGVVGLSKSLGRVLVALIALGMLAGLPPLVQRARMEAADKTVNLVADEATFTAMAQSQGANPESYLRQLHAAGITSLGVAEDSLLSLQAGGLAQFWSGSDLLATVALGPLPGPFAGRTIHVNDTYVEVQSPSLGRWLTTSLGQRLPAGAVSVWSAANPTVLALAAPTAEVQGLGLGFRPGRLRALAALGFDIVPRLADDPSESPAAITATIRQAAAAVPIHTVIFAGGAVTGYPNHLAVTEAALRAVGWNVGAIETVQQLGNVNQFGLTALVAGRPNHVVRVYSVPAFVLQDQTPSQAQQTIMDGVVGRNLRIVYLHPYTPATDPGNVLADNLQRWGALAQRLRGVGFTLGPPTAFPSVRVQTRYVVLLNIGVWAAALWLLLLLFPKLRRDAWAWLVIGGVLAAGASAAKVALAQEGGALLASVVFPTLAAWYAARVWDRLDRPVRRWMVWREALVTTVGTALISGVGAYLLSALLSSTAYMQEWVYFRGVKVSYILPPMLTAVVFLVAVGVSGLRRRGETAPLGRELSALARTLIRGENLAALAVLLGGAAYYVLRSGNVSTVAAFELAARHLLDRELLYRPRTKEFLIGYPSMFLAVWLASRRRAGWFWIFLLAASTGLVSMVNSFEHIRTPLINSAMSVVYGLILGAVIGSVALVVVDVVADAFGWGRAGTASPAAATPEALADGHGDKERPPERNKPRRAGAGRRDAG